MFSYYDIKVCKQNKKSNNSIGLLKDRFNQKKLGSFSTNICRFSPPLLTIIAPIFMKDAHSAESNENAFFRLIRFLFFELWLILFTIYGDTCNFKYVIDQKKVVQKLSNLQERCGFMSFFCATFSFLDMVDFDVCDLMCA